MIFIYTTFPSKEEAKKISTELIKKQFAACVNLFPIESLYVWEGKLVDGKEYGAIIKTRRAMFIKVKQYIVEHHSYKVPCIIEVPLGRVHKLYEKWLEVTLPNFRNW